MDSIIGLLPTRYFLTPFLNTSRNNASKTRIVSGRPSMTKVLITANDHQHLLAGSDRNTANVLIMANDHYHLLEAMLLQYNRDRD